MRRGRIFIYLALIVILGLVAAYIIWQRFIVPTPGPQVAGEAAPTTVPEVQTVDVVIVTQPLARGALIDETVLEFVPYPQDIFLPTMFTDMAQVVGRQAKFDLDSGIPLTSGMLVDSAEQLSATGSIAALSIPQGMVAVSLPISRLSSVSYAPRPGDHVSVIMTLLMVDVDSEFQTTMPNLATGVIAPGPGAVLGTNATQESADTSTEFPPQTVYFMGAEGDRLSAITAQVTYGGPLSYRGRTELDPLLNELFYVVPSEVQRARLVSQTFLPDVMVLGVGNFPLEEEVEAAKTAAETAQEAAQAAEDAAAEPTPPEEGQVVAEQPVIEPPDIITIVVRPQDAVTLNYLLYAGAELTLALRSFGDTTVESTEAATLQFLLDEYNIAVPARLPYGLEPRIDELIPPTLSNDTVNTETP